MKKIQAFLVVASLILFTFAMLSPGAGAATAVTGRTIALDSGHGFNGETGAVGVCNGEEVAEVLVNDAVREMLSQKLSDDGAQVILVPQLETRKERALYAESQGAEVLISVHHNGSSNTSVDYTRSFVTQKEDKEFAEYIHPHLASTFGPDRGIKNDGYGMTVYGDMPGVLTESYFITNTNNACDFLNGAIDSDGMTIVEVEVEAMYQGLIEYFEALGSDDGGDDDDGSDDGGGNDCPPGWQKQGRC